MEQILGFHWKALFCLAAITGLSAAFFIWQYDWSEPLTGTFVALAIFYALLTYHQRRWRVMPGDHLQRSDYDGLLNHLNIQRQIELSLFALGLAFSILTIWVWSHLKLASIVLTFFFGIGLVLTLGIEWHLGVELERRREASNR